MLVAHNPCFANSLEKKKKKKETSLKFSQGIPTVLKKMVIYVEEKS